MVSDSVLLHDITAITSNSRLKSYGDSMPLTHFLQGNFEGNICFQTGVFYSFHNEESLHLNSSDLYMLLFVNKLSFVWS